MKWHLLKCWPDSFDAVMRGVKPFEARVNDRDFNVNDILVLQEYIPEGSLGNRFIQSMATPRGYTGRAMVLRVTYMITTKDSKFAKDIPEGLSVVAEVPEIAIMAVEPWRDDERIRFIKGSIDLSGNGSGPFVLAE